MATSGTSPRDEQAKRSTKPNSLTCAAIRPTRKLFRRVNRLKRNKKYKISGFPIRMKDMSAILGRNAPDTLSTVILLPSKMKKRMRKKSRSGRILLAISDWYTEEPREMPAIIAPISNDNPARRATLATIKHQAIVNKKRNSPDAAIRSMINGSKNLTKK